MSSGPSRDSQSDVYDLIVAGAGLGGLSFLWHLLESSPEPRRVLVVDRSFEAAADRTWCFWGPEDAPFADLAQARWSHAEVRVADRRHDASLGELFYHCVPSEVFRQKVLERVAEVPWITMLAADVYDLGEGEHGPYIDTDQGRFVGKWMVQSLRFLGEGAFTMPRYPVRQHFGGIEVRTETPVFDAERFTLMDFSVPQRGGTAFMYVLPFAPDRALIEHTMFSTDALPPEEHFAAAEAYLNERFGVPFEVVRREAGNIPMDDRFPAQQASPHVFNIGIAGGQIKPCTGYTFARVQRHAQALAQLYADQGVLEVMPGAPSRFRFYDLLFLRVLHDEPGRVVDIFQRLLMRSPMPRVLGFLDEQTHLGQDISLFAKLPAWPFLKGVPGVAARLVAPALPSLPSLPPKGLWMALGIYLAWVASFVIGLSGAHPGAGLWFADAGWIALQMFLSTGVFITAHDAMHGLVVPGRGWANRAVGWVATWSYAGLDYDKLAAAHHQHHAEPATEHDPDYHSGNPNVLAWYVDFMRQYLSVRQVAWLLVLDAALVFGFGLSQLTVAVFWGVPLILSTLQLFLVGTWLVHRPGTYLGEGNLKARSVDVHPVWSFLACYHFGYHFEHHARPDLPWWSLWRFRGIRPERRELAGGLG